jgi:hypothetical protein
MYNFPSRGATKAPTASSHFVLRQLPIRTLARSIGQHCKQRRFVEVASREAEADANFCCVGKPFPTQKYRVRFSDEDAMIPYVNVAFATILWQGRLADIATRRELKIMLVHMCLGKLGGAKYKPNGCLRPAG